MTVPVNIEELNLSVRSYNCLRHASVRAVAQLIELTPSQLLRFKMLGRKSVLNIQEALKEFNLTLKEEETPESARRLRIYAVIESGRIQFSSFSKNKALSKTRDFRDCDVIAFTEPCAVVGTKRDWAWETKPK